MNTREKRECMRRFIVSVENMGIEVPSLNKVKDIFKNELEKKGQLMRIYGDVEELNSIIYGHMEAEIDEEDFKELSEEQIKEILLDEGEFVIDDMDMDTPSRILNIEAEYEQ